MPLLCIYTKAVPGKKCKSPPSCNFVIVLNKKSFMHLFNVSASYMQSI